jgi:hypothetical protein
MRGRFAVRSACSGRSYDNKTATYVHNMLVVVLFIQLENVNDTIRGSLLASP